MHEGRKCKNDEDFLPVDVDVRKNMWVKFCLEQVYNAKKVRVCSFLGFRFQNT